MALTEHLKMMRLLFLCLLLLPALTALSEESEGSADAGVDDEDLNEESFIPDVHSRQAPGSLADKTTGVEENSDQFTMIVIIVAVTALTLSAAAIITIMLVRRHMHKQQQQGIYSVPTEQDQKGV